MTLLLFWINLAVGQTKGQPQADLPDAPLITGEYSDPLPVIVQNADGSLRKILPGGSSVPYKEKEPRTLTKWFLIGHGLSLGTVIFDVEMTHQGIAHHKCVENEVGDPFPSRGGMYRTDLLAFAGFTALDYALAIPHISPKWLPLHYETAIINGAYHLKGGIKWATQCW